MAMSQKALQSKREKKKKLRQVKKINPTLSTPSHVKFSKWPIYECWAPSELWELGLGQVIVTRRNSLGEIALGLYLVDTFCLGIKDCFLRLIDPSEYKNFLNHVSMVGGDLELIEPSYASALIYKAKEYALQLGFKPHSDFSKAEWMLKDIPIDETQKFVFGKEGKPFYVQGPNESLADINRIMKTLEKTASQETNDFLLASPE